VHVGAFDAHGYALNARWRARHAVPQLPTAGAGE
jgi:hypothetical protein